MPRIEMAVQHRYDNDALNIIGYLLMLVFARPTPWHILDIF